MNIIRTLQEKGVTVILITHHMDEAAQADRVVVMKKGRIAMDGTPKALFSQTEALTELGLEVPDTIALLRKLQEAGFDLPSDALSIEECAKAIAETIKAGN